jgi:hypothetical protein
MIGNSPEVSNYPSVFPGHRLCVEWMFEGYLSIYRVILKDDILVIACQFVTNSGCIGDLQILDGIHV